MSIFFKIGLVILIVCLTLFLFDRAIIITSNNQFNRITDQCSKAVNSLSTPTKVINPEDANELYHYCIGMANQMALAGVSADDEDIAIMIAKVHKEAQSE